MYRLLLVLPFVLAVTACDSITDAPPAPLTSAALDVHSGEIPLMTARVEAEAGDVDVFNAVAEAAVASVGAEFGVPLLLRARVPGGRSVEARADGPSTDADDVAYAQAALTSILETAATALEARTYDGRGVLVRGLSKCQLATINAPQGPDELTPGGSCTTACGTWTECEFLVWGCSNYYGYITSCDNGSTIYTAFDSYDQRAQLCG